MKEAHHQEITEVAADIVGWGDMKAECKSASFPDEIQAISVAGIGTRIFGCNLASLTHFCIPVHGNDRFTGYCWHRDDSMPHIDLPDRDVSCNYMAWVRSYGLVSDYAEQEPLFQLIRVLRTPSTHGTTAADELTYPTAAVMAGWLAQAIEKKQFLNSGTDIVGWCLHFVQDCCVPHHAKGFLLQGHAAYESNLYEHWIQTRYAKTSEFMLWKDAADTGEKRLPRDLAQEQAVISHASSTLSLQGCCERALKSSVSVMRYLKELL